MLIRVAILVVALLIVATGSPLGVELAAADGPDRIDSPANGAMVKGVVEIRGRATGPDISRFSFYRISIGEGKDPPNMRPLGPPYDKPVEDGVLATWDTDRFPSGSYTLLLQVYDRDNTITSASTLVMVADKPTPSPAPLTGPVVYLTPVEVTDPTPAAPPPAPPSTGDGTIPLDLPTFVPPPTLAPLAPIPGPSGPGVPINPIPINPDAPPPVRLDTPAQTDPNQLPFSPAPVYITPVEYGL